MNEYDTEIVKTILKRHHYDFADSPEEAEANLQGVEAERLTKF